LSTFLAGEPDGMDVRDRDQFKSLAKQAIGFAQRWTSLVGGQKNRTTFFSQDHEDLKREIRERFPDVRQEITALIEKSHSPSIALAGRCLLQSLDDVHDRIENATGSDLEEPDPRHLLSGDLLRIPGLRLNASWQPSQSGSALLDTLARAFTEPLPNWEMAIIQHMDQFDLDSVDRILSLNHWTNAERQRWQRWANIRRRHALQENSSAARERTRPAEPVSGRLSDSKVLLEMSAKLAALKQEIEQKKQEQEDTASALDDSTLDLQLNESKPSLRERLRNLATTTDEPRNESTDTSDHSQWIIDLDDGDSQ
ncbi:MAG: hypothetical protein KDA80_16380, partial [Planctomycetaceae bacterium]|nr:hypothetical protein [Planctomycetaceae bacterium]